MSYTAKLIKGQAKGATFVDRKIATGGELGNQALTGVIHPFWGVVMRNDTSRLADVSDNALKEMYDDAIPRELGISKKIQANNRVLNGLADPGTYLASMNDALYNIGIKVAELYREEFVNQYNLGKSREEAKRIARKFAEMNEEFLLGQYYEEYPTALTNTVTKQLGDRVGMTNF